MKNLIPWNWGAHKVPVTREDEYAGLFSLQREMNRLFENFFRDTEMATLFPEEEQLSQFTPHIDLKETQDSFILTAEVPGMSEKELEVSISDRTLTIRGEKNEEKEENLKGYYRMERKFGAFQRSIPVPYEVEVEKAEALFNHGVLKVTLPKTKKASTSPKIVAVKGGS